MTHPKQVSGKNDLSATTNPPPFAFVPTNYSSIPFIHRLLCSDDRPRSGFRSWQGVGPGLVNRHAKQPAFYDGGQRCVPTRRRIWFNPTFPGTICPLFSSGGDRWLAMNATINAIAWAGLILLWAARPACCRPHWTAPVRAGLINTTCTRMCCEHPGSAGVLQQTKALAAVLLPPTRPHRCPRMPASTRLPRTLFILGAPANA